MRRFRPLIIPVKISTKSNSSIAPMESPKEYQKFKANERESLNSRGSLPELQRTYNRVFVVSTNANRLPNVDQNILCDVKSFALFTSVYEIVAWKSD